MNIDFYKQLTVRKKEGKKLCVLTAYDFPMARILSESGIELILVGDSLGMVILGLPDTTQVSLSAMCHHISAVARGAPKSQILADLPKDTYNSPKEALYSAQCLLAAGANAVKLEGGQEISDSIHLLTQSQIPVAAHIGMLPQHIHEEGRYRIKGKTPDEAEQLQADALAIQAAGAFAVVLELVFPPVAQAISESLQIPTIGIGSGSECDGQVLVTHDLIGLSPWSPSFVRPMANTAQLIRQTIQSWVQTTQGCA